VPASDADALVSALTEQGQTIATAESLTGGRLCAALVDVPGASAVVRGAVVAYASEVKTGLLGVDPSIVEQHGAVSAETARAMAEQARALLGADFGVATTGVAGPDPAEGLAPGTAYVAVAGPERVVDRQLALDGDRDAVRAGTVRASLVLALEEVAGSIT
jgi:nicotinamide-nucleotide amidase